MKKVIFFWFSFFIMNNLMAQQNAVTEGNRAAILKVKRILPGDSVRAVTDTMYMMNSMTFRQVSEGWQSNMKLKTILNDEIDQYEEHELIQDSDYEEMKNAAAKQEEELRLYTQKMNAAMSDLGNQLKQSMEKIEAAEIELDQLRTDLKAQRWRAVRGKTLWGLGGVATGMIIVLLFR